jgi:hypothetical protein
MSLLDDYWNAPGKLTQAQRSKARAMQDRLDSMACAASANDRCAVCGEWSGYDGNSQFSGSMHHASRKHTKEIRHDKRYHFWVCHTCHRLAHESNDNGVRARIDAIIERRLKT